MLGFKMLSEANLIYLCFEDFYIYALFYFSVL